MNRHKGQVDADTLVGYRMTPDKAEWCNRLPVGRPLLALTRQDSETYHDHRLRLKRDVLGLGLCKASFLTALLDPLNADVACIDTHMQKVYLGNTGFRSLSMTTYLGVEAKVRKVAERHHVSTFLAQWMIWDHTRGSTTTHAIFPGSHK